MVQTSLPSFFWGGGRTLSEYDDLVMKHKPDTGRCKLSKHPIELEPEASPHRVETRRFSADLATKANQEVQNLLTLGLIQPSY